MIFEEWYEENVKYMNLADFKPWLSEAWNAAKKDEEGLDENEDDVVHYILIEEDSHGNLTWDSSYETLDEFMEVMHIVAAEVQQPVIMTYPLH